MFSLLKFHEPVVLYYTDGPVPLLGYLGKEKNIVQLEGGLLGGRWAGSLLDVPS